MKRFLLIPLALILISGLIFSGCAKPAPAPAPAPTPAPAPPKTLKIGVILQLTGWYSAVDANDEGDCKIVAQMINDRGILTIQGQKYNVELVEEDGKSTVDGNTTAANKLVLDEKVKFAVGPAGPFPIAVTSIFNAAKVLNVIGYYTMEPGVMGPTLPYIFLGHIDPIGQFSAEAKAMQKVFPDVKNVVIASGDEPATDAIAPGVKNRLENMGYNVVGDVVKFPLEAEDYSPIAAKLNAITQADAYFFLLGTPPNLCLTLKGLRALGNNKPYVMSIPFAFVLAIAGPEASNNVLCNLAYMPNQTGNPPLVDEVHNRGPADRPWYGLTPHALWVLGQVIQAANSLDPDAVKAKWESMDKVSTLHGEGTICGDKTFGVHHSIVFPCSSVKLMNGQPIYSGWVTPDPTP